MQLNSSSTEFNAEYWKKCSSCKKPISYRHPYWICSVSTCTRKRTGLVFCSVSCFDAHVPGANHRSAGAIEQKAPSFEQWRQQWESENSPSSVEQDGSKSDLGSSLTGSEDDILVVVSKVKAYVKARGDCNTSESFISKVSSLVRQWSDEAIKNAERVHRKTVMEYDFGNSEHSGRAGLSSSRLGSAPKGSPTTIIRRPKAQ